MRFRRMVVGVALIGSACSYQTGPATDTNGAAQGASRFDLPTETSTTTTTIAPATPPAVATWFGSDPSEINSELVIPERTATPADLGNLTLDGFVVTAPNDAMTGHPAQPEHPDSVTIETIDLMAPSGDFIPVDVLFGPNDTVNATAQAVHDTYNSESGSPITASAEGYAALAYPVVRVGSDITASEVINRAKVFDMFITALTELTDCVNCPPTNQSFAPESAIIWSGSGVPAEVAKPRISGRVPDATVTAMGATQSERWWLSDGVLSYTLRGQTAVGLSNALAASRDRQWHAWVTGDQLFLAREWPVDVTLTEPPIAVNEELSTYQFEIGAGETVNAISVADTEDGAIVALNSGSSWRFVTFDGSSSEVAGTISDPNLSLVAPFGGRWFGVRSADTGDELVVLPTFDSTAAKVILMSADRITSWDISSSGNRVLLTTAAAGLPLTWIADGSGTIEKLEIPAANAVWSP